MIPVAEAKTLLKQHLPTPVRMKVALCHAYGKKVSSDLYAPIPLPPFTQSSVDGYAIRFQEFKNNHFKLVGSIAAGDNSLFSLKSGMTSRIMTGAKLPDGADTVVMQEHAKVCSEGIVFDLEQLKIGQNVRLTGSQIHRGALAFQKGQIVTPAAAGYLSGLGFTEIEVFKQPLVSILTTGNEVIEPGLPLTPGKIYNSNKELLCAALDKYGICPVHVAHVIDDPDLITHEIQKGLEVSDLILISGGISVGAHDHIATSLEKAGVIKLFHGVKQKPGKPLYFGMLGNKMVFGLPGNPGASLTCFYEYVTMALQSKDDCCISLPLKHRHDKAAGLTHFLKGIAHDTHVEILSGQDSYMLHSYANANCLVCIPQDKESVLSGELVTVRVIV